MPVSVRVHVSMLQPKICAVLIRVVGITAPNKSGGKDIIIIQILRRPQIKADCKFPLDKVCICNAKLLLNPWSHICKGFCL